MLEMTVIVLKIIFLVLKIIYIFRLVSTNN